MNENTVFDCVVLGESVAGLWGAKQLIDKGMQVLVVPTGTSSRENIVPKFIADEFGLISEQPFLQVLLPEKRVRIFHEEERFKQEFEFQFGKPFHPASGFDPRLIRGLSYYAQGGDVGANASDAAALYSKVSDTAYFEQSPGWVTNELLKGLEKRGATVVKPGNLSRVFIDRKTFVGVQLANTSKMLSAQRAFANTHVDYLNSFFSEPLTMKSKPKGWIFEITFECARDSLPIGLSDRMVYVEEKAPILEIIQTKPGQFRLKTMLPMEEHTLDRGEQRRLASRMLKVCESILPDLEYNLRRVSPDLRDPERAMNSDLPALYPFQELHRIPSHLLVFGGQSSFASPLAGGLFLTSEEANPKDGIWGGMDSTRSALKAFEPNPPGK